MRKNQYMTPSHHFVFCDCRKYDCFARTSRKNEQGFRPALFPFFFYTATGFFLIRSKLYRHFLFLLCDVVRNVIIGLVVVLAIIDFRAASHADKLIAPPCHFYLATSFCKAD